MWLYAIANFFRQHPPTALAGALIAGTGLAVAVSQFRINRDQAARSEANLVSVLSKEWRELAPAWAMAMTTVRGAGDFYALSAWEERERYVAVKIALGAEDLDFPVSDSIRLEYEGMSHERLHFEDFSYSLQQRVVLDFLARLAGSLIQGQINVSALYHSFGSQVLNSSGSVRKLFEEYQPQLLLRGQADRILIFLDLMWAYGVKIGDMVGADVAGYKRLSGSGGLFRTGAKGR